MRAFGARKPAGVCTSVHFSAGANIARKTKENQKESESESGLNPRREPVRQPLGFGCTNVQVAQPMPHLHGKHVPLMPALAAVGREHLRDSAKRRPGDTQDECACRLSFPRPFVCRSLYPLPSSAVNSGKTKPNCIYRMHKHGHAALTFECPAACSIAMPNQNRRWSRSLDLQRIFARNAQQPVASPCPTKREDASTFPKACLQP